MEKLNDEASRRTYRKIIYDHDIYKDFLDKTQKHQT